MRLKDLFKDTGIKINKDIEVKGIEINSKNVKKDYIFFALKGEKTDGNKFIEEAIKNGATVVVTQENISLKTDDVILIKVDDVNKTLSRVSSNFFHNPTSKIKTIGITGTKGKTSVSHFIEQILAFYGLKPSIVGTINYHSHKRVIMESPNTTPYPPLLDKVINEVITDGSDLCIMEVSSHALKLKKVDSIEFDIAVFTNLASDHLDFHKTINDYKESKLRLFKLLDNSPKSEKYASINIDDPFSEEVIKEIKNSKIISYSINKDDAEVSASNIILKQNYTEFKLKILDKKFDVKVPIIGSYNVANILASIAASLPLIKDYSNITEILANIKPAKGRLQKIISKRGFTIYIDYAHTEKSLEEVLKTLSEIPHRRIITVFGCGGDRDPTKRQPMGMIASLMSDTVIITSDNPRTEEPIKIIKEIELGAKKTNKNNYIIIEDRSKAIKKAIEIAQKDDIILIAGKGHEEYQIIGDKKIPFSDFEEVIKNIGEREYES